MRTPAGRLHGRPRRLAASPPHTRLGSTAPKLLEGGLGNQGRKETAARAGRLAITDHHGEDTHGDRVCPGLWVTWKQRRETDMCASL